MDNKNDLKKELKVLKKQILNGAKDAHWMENALREYESIVGQLKHQPLALDCGEEIDEWKGETFRITKTTKGVMYHTYGGYTIFCTPNINSLYDVLVDIIDNKEKYDSLVGKEREEHELAMSALAYCISLPSFVCQDANFLYETAGNIIEWLRNVSEGLLNKELQEESEEDLRKNEEYRQATLEFHGVIDDVSAEIEEINKK